MGEIPVNPAQLPALLMSLDNSANPQGHLWDLSSLLLLLVPAVYPFHPVKVLTTLQTPPEITLCFWALWVHMSPARHPLGRPEGVPARCCGDMARAPREAGLASSGCAPGEPCGQAAWGGHAPPTGTSPAGPRAPGGICEKPSMMAVAFCNEGLLCCF